jgi:hypothetical protein
MLSKMTAVAAAAALIGFALTPTDASARSGGMHGGGAHVAHFGGFHGGHFHRFHGFHGARFGFVGVYPGYYAYSGYPYYYDDDCYLRRRVVATPWGPRVRLVRVCGYY